MLHIPHECNLPNPQTVKHLANPMVLLTVFLHSAKLMALLKASLTVCLRMASPMENQMEFPLKV